MTLRWILPTGLRGNGSARNTTLPGAGRSSSPRVPQPTSARSCIPPHALPLSTGPVGLFWVRARDRDGTRGHRAARPAECRQSGRPSTGSQLRSRSRDHGRVLLRARLAGSGSAPAALALNGAADYGSRHLEGDIWNSLGYTEYHAGDLGEAAACYERALSIFQTAGDRWGQADTLTNLGDIRRAAGDRLQAQDAWQQAHDILDDLQHPDAAKLRAKLVSMDKPSY
jgi:Tetratricopeptide repeat